MALLWLDSFDHYATADFLEKWTGIINGAPTITAAAGRRSSAALTCGSTTGGALVLAPSGSTVVVGFALKLTVLSGQNNILTIANGATFHVNLHINTSGTLGVGRGGDAGTTPTAVLGTSTATLTTGTYYYVEVKFTIHDTTGTAEVRVNETPVIGPLTLLDTNNGGAAAWDGVRVAARSSIQTFQIDDLYILDGSGSAPLNTFLGDCRVDARYPTAEGAASAWTPLSGTDNALMVDETAPDDDTTYTATATVGATDTHVVQDAPVAGAVLYGVQLVLSAKKSDAGTCTIAPVLRHSTTDYPGTAFSPSTSYAYAVRPYGADGTGAAWTEAVFNAAEFGYTRTA